MINGEFFALIGKNSEVHENVIIGLKYKKDCEKARIGNNSVIRAGSIIYADVSIGDYFQTGHNVVIRGKTMIGNHVTMGTNTVVEGNVKIGDFVKIESNCYIPTHTEIGSRVFFGPNATLTNDKYPLKMRNQYSPKGPKIEDNVTLGAGAIVLPGIKIGKGSFISAATVVTKDIPTMSLVKGIPGKIYPLPKKLQELNTALSWKEFLDG